MSTPDYSWQETSPGEYTRDSDELETFYTTLAKTWSATGRTYFGITAYLGFSVSVSESQTAAQVGADIETAFRKAWRWARFEHPSLAAPVVWDATTGKCRKLYHTVTSEEECERWMEETFHVIDDGQSGEEFANSDPDVGRFATLYLVTPPRDAISTQTPSKDTREVVFRGSHDLIDGIGTLTLLNQLLQHASTVYTHNPSESPIPPLTGDEHLNLSPSFRTLASLPSTPSPTQLQNLRTIGLQNRRTSSTSGQTLSLPLISDAQTPTRARRAAIYLTPATTLAVLAACKARITTVTQVVHSSIALAVRDLQAPGDEERDCEYVSYALLNLRGACVKAPDTRASAAHPYTAAGVYHGVSGRSLVVHLAVPSCREAHCEKKSVSEFNDVLDEVRGFYRGVGAGVLDGDFLSLVPELFRVATPEWPSEEECKLVPERNECPSVSLSSLGLLEGLVSTQGSFEVEKEPWVMGAEYSTGLGVFLGTWRGRICLSAGYNEAFRTEEWVVAFLRRVERILLQGLGVGVDRGLEI